jgi:hypothetical protein
MISQPTAHRPQQHEEEVLGEFLPYKKEKRSSIRSPSTPGSRPEQREQGHEVPPSQDYMGLGSDENRVPIIGTEVSNIGNLTHICPSYRVLIDQARLYRFRIAASKCRHQLNGNSSSITKYFLLL